MTPIRVQWTNASKKSVVQYYGKSVCQRTQDVAEKNALFENYFEHITDIPTFQDAMKCKLTLDSRKEFIRMMKGQVGETDDMDLIHNFGDCIQDKKRNHDVDGINLL